MSSDIFYDPEIFTKSYEEALKYSEQTLNRIRSFKKELEDVKLNLEQNQNHLFQNIMVPIGSKALMRGQLVHTNEVTINVGDRWFIKKSAAGAIQTCNRMLERCDQNIAEYEKEMHLLSSNLDVPKDYEIFASGDVQDIVEPYDEDEEKRWREQHREKVRQYRQQLASSRESEEDMFKRLDKLEEKEEEEAEEEDENDDDDDDSSYDDEDIDEEEYNKLIEESIRLNQEKAEPSTSSTVSESENSVIPHRALSKRVSFSESLETTQEFSTSTVDDVIVINFKHSQTPVKCAPNASIDETINSPSDIYKKYLNDFENITRKSILKKKSFVNEDGVSEVNVPFVNNVIFTEADILFRDKPEKVQKSIIKIQKNPVVKNKSVFLDEKSADEVFGDIVEKTPIVVPKVENNPRPVSRFKQSRIKTSSTS